MLLHNYLTAKMIIVKALMTLEKTHDSLSNAVKKTASLSHKKKAALMGG